MLKYIPLILIFFLSVCLIYLNNNNKNDELSDDNKIVQSLWIGDELSFIEILCIKSFMAKGHEFHLYTYSRIKNIPDGCIVKDGNEILPENKIFYYSKAAGKGKGSISAFSNMFRYKLLYDKGGYWVDMDMVCLKYFDFKTPYVFSSEKISSKKDDQVINSGVIKCPKGSNFAKFCYDETVKVDKNKLEWGVIGPRLTRKSVERYGLKKYVKSWDTFCPFHYDELDKFRIQDMKHKDNWYGMHLWNEIWRRNNFNKNDPKKGSEFYKLCTEYRLIKN